MVRFTISYTVFGFQRIYVVNLVHIIAVATLYISIHRGLVLFAKGRVARLEAGKDSEKEEACLQGPDNEKLIGKAKTRI